MQPLRFRALGPGSVLGALRAELKKAAREVVIVGPFIDDYFASAVIVACPRSVQIRVLTRPLSSVDPSFAIHADNALSRFAERRATEVRTLDRLHAKVAMIDEARVFCGSANWYRYSLEEALEVVLHGPVSEVPTLLDEIASLWDQGSPALSDRSQPSKPGSTSELSRTGSVARGAPFGTTTPQGYAAEVLDPIAAAKLASVRGAFVIGPKKQSPSKR